MGITIKTLNCNASCLSCYERRIRENYPKKYDLDAMVRTLKTEMEKSSSKNNPTIHGGEPLLLKMSELERLFKIIYEKYKSTGIQTNLLLLNDKHIKLFKKYNTHVGISLDGITMDTNRGRGYDPQPVWNSIKILYKNKIRMSLITVLRKYNCPGWYELILEAQKYDIKDFRFIPGIIFDEKLRIKEEVDNYKLEWAFKKLADLTFSDLELMILPFNEIVEMLMGFKHSSCSFWTCDPYCTNAETPIMHDGTLGNCLKGAGAVDGVVTLRDNEQSFERYEMLKQLPQNENGCKDCKYWFICHGGCSGAGIDNDWRNRTRFCEAWKSLYEYIEDKIKGLFPNIYLITDYYPYNTDSRTIIDSIRESTWRKEKRKNLNELKKRTKENKNDCLHLDDHGDKHGDIPHGDSNDPVWRKANPDQIGRKRKKRNGKK